MDIDSLRQLIRDTLTPLGLYSSDAEELLCATCAQESHLGEYRHQIHGPAVGIFQMEPEDFNDIWTNYLAYHFELSAAVRALSGTLTPVAGDMEHNDAFAIMLARVHYLRYPDPLPSADDLAGLWSLYKSRWNTSLGAATQEQFYANYRTYVGGPAS